jgi:hypothetical protein
MLCHTLQDSIAATSAVSSSSSTFELKMRLRLLDLNVLLYNSHQPAWMTAAAASTNSSSRSYTNDGWNSDALASGGSHFLLSAQHMAYSLHKAGAYICTYTAYFQNSCLLMVQHHLSMLSVAIL